MIIVNLVKNTDKISLHVVAYQNFKVIIDELFLQND